MLILFDSEERAKDFELLGPALDDEKTRNLLLHVRKILAEKDEFEAVSYLDRLDFGLSKGINPFRDEFCVLHTSASFDMHEFLRKAIEEAPDSKTKEQFVRPFKLIASTITYITDSDIYVRFVGCQLDLSQPPAINYASNQAVHTFPDSPKITYQGLNFRSKTEIKVFEALVRKGLLVFPLPTAVLGEIGKYKEPDFVVFYEGKVGILEIHGDNWHTPETAAEEHERCRVFKRLGVSVCEIFDARRCWDNPDAVVGEFLQELARS